jgi:hypothetical protein
VTAGGVLLGGFVSGCVCGMLGSTFFMRLHGHLMRLMGVLKGLSGVFMPRQVILFFMALRGGTMSVCSKIVKFSSFPMGIAHTSSGYERVSIRPDLL